MAFFRNDAVNRVNLHSGIQALAEGAGGIFFLVYMLKAGVSIPVALTAQAAIFAGRFVMRPAILPLAKRLGLKPMVIIGTLGIAMQYPLLAEVDGVGVELLLVCIAASIGEVLYWPSYNAYFATIGDAEHRGHQVSARMALVSMVSIVAPILGTWALVTLGPHPMFAAVGMVQALAIVPLIGAPNVAVRASAPGALRAARLGVILYAADGWLDAWFILVWQIALFVSLGESISAYGGAMALAALVGAGCGLILGRHVDQGHGRRTVVIAYTVATAIVLMRASSFDSAWLAVTSNALGALVLPLIIPAQSTASYNLAKASPCPMRFIIACEAGWDVGCASGCLLGAALAMMDVPLSITILLALPALAILARVLRQYFANGAEIPILPPTHAGLTVRDGA
jgi:MFS transporter, DHA1 family, inner membrane transport protein